MQAHKLKVNIPKDHQLEIRLPDDFPSGPAEVIVLAARSDDEKSRRSMMEAVSELRDLRRTPEEDLILDEFEEFRRTHPFSLNSLAREE